MNGTRRRGDSRRRKDKVEEAKTIRKEMAEWKRRTTKRNPKSEGSVGSRERKGREGGGREKKCKQSLGI